jgi:histidinol-phosphate phosphatase family protein
MNGPRLAPVSGPELISWRADSFHLGDRCVFLDRDGVLNEHLRGSYVLAWDQFSWRRDARDALGELSNADVPIIVVTNQSCIGRGLLSIDEFRAIMERCLSTCRDWGVSIAAWYCCPHVPDDRCCCRKPGTLMFEAAEADLGVHCRDSFLIGDSLTDIEAAARMGMRAWLVGAAEPLSFAAAARHIRSILRDHRDSGGF